MDLEGLSYRELQRQCKDLGLPAAGKREVLIERIQAQTSEDKRAEETDDAPGIATGVHCTHVGELDHVVMQEEEQVEAQQPDASQASSPSESTVEEPNMDVAEDDSPDVKKTPEQTVEAPEEVVEPPAGGLSLCHADVVKEADESKIELAADTKEVVADKMPASTGRLLDFDKIHKKQFAAQCSIAAKTSLPASSSSVNGGVKAPSASLPPRKTMTSQQKPAPTAGAPFMSPSFKERAARPSAVGTLPPPMPTSTSAKKPSYKPYKGPVPQWGGDSLFSPKHKVKPRSVLNTSRPSTADNKTEAITENVDKRQSSADVTKEMSKGSVKRSAKTAGLSPTPNKRPVVG